MNKYNLVVAFCFFMLNIGTAQRLKYSEIEKEDARNMNFDIIGKFSDKIIVYKNFRTDNYFSVYDTDMKLKDKIKLSNLPSKLINADFVAYPNYFYMIYQYQKKNVIYCEAIKFDQNGKKTEETFLLDTTSIPALQNDNKIYSILVSDNKQKIAVIKANKKNDKNHIFGVVLLNQELKQQYKRFFNVNMDGRNNFLDEFVIDNEGDIYMAKCFSVNGNEYINKFEVLLIPNNRDTLLAYNIESKEKILDEVIMRVDNVNKRVILQSYYFSKKRGNIEGLFVNFFDKNMPTISQPVFTKFNDTLRTEAKGVSSVKMAFNDFFIRQVFPRKDGGFIVTAESYYTTSRGNSNPWNRWDYFSGTPYLTNFDYYNMGARNWYWNSWDRFNNQSTTFIAENIVVLSMSKNGNLEWSNVVHKNQKEEGLEDLVSFQVLLTGGELHFLFNERDRSNYLMNDNSITPTGNLTRHPTLKNLNRQYELMPRHGKQISAREMIFPCTYKNYICFAKIEY